MATHSSTQSVHCTATTRKEQFERERERAREQYSTPKDATMIISTELRNTCLILNSEAHT
jgi:hypothetical protein